MGDDAGVDLSNRDPNSLNDNVNVVFEDVLGETDAAHSIDCVWTNSYKCFTGGKKCCYLALSTICGLPIALCWGCEFACITFSYVWYITPTMKCCEFWLTCMKRLYAIFIQCCLSPCIETLAGLFSKIVVTQG